MKSNIKQFEEKARQGWLAGLGLYGNGWQFISEKLDKAYEEVNDTVNQLIANGEKVEAELQQKLDTNKVLDQQIGQLREKLGLNSSPYDEKLIALSSKVDALTESVSKLAEQRAAEQAQAPVKKAAPRKAPAKKVAEGTAAKAPAKTARTRKAPAKKATPKAAEE